MKPSLRVLVVDDSVVVRQALRDGLSRVPGIATVDAAPDGRIALQKVQRSMPDVVTLDVEMPGLDGLETLERIMQTAPCPVIMLSAFTFGGADKTIRALELGAVDFVTKPAGGRAGDIRSVIAELAARIAAVTASGPRALRRRPVEPEPTRAEARAERPLESASAPRRVVAIGASTGGTEAVRHILCRLPGDLEAGVVIVQHMPEGFTRAFASRLDELSPLAVKEASHRDLIRAGRVLVAPGHSHMVVRREGPLAFVELNRQPKVSGHRPSVDVLFRSAASAYGSDAVAVILTGMGRDGAEGMRAVHDRGGATVAQDRESSVVFGMPKAAVEEGGVREVATLDDIPYRIRMAVAAPGRGTHHGAAQPAALRAMAAAARREEE